MDWAEGFLLKGAYMLTAAILLMVSVAIGFIGLRGWPVSDRQRWPYFTLALALIIQPVVFYQLYLESLKSKPGWRGIPFTLFEFLRRLFGTWDFTKSTPSALVLLLVFVASAVGALGWAWWVLRFLREEMGNSPKWMGRVVILPFYLEVLLLYWSYVLLVVVVFHVAGECIWYYWLK